MENSKADTLRPAWRLGGSFPTHPFPLGPPVDSLYRLINPHYAMEIRYRQDQAHDDETLTMILTLTLTLTPTPYSRPNILKLILTTTRTFSE